MTWVKIIENETDYDEAMERVHYLADLDPKDGTPEAHELDALVAVIASYEEAQGYMPTDDVTPLEFVQFYLEQNALTAEEKQKA